MKKLLKFGLMSVWAISFWAVIFGAALKGGRCISTTECVIYSLIGWVGFITSTMALIKIEETEGK